MPTDRPSSPRAGGDTAPLPGGRPRVASRHDGGPLTATIPLGTATLDRPIGAGASAIVYRANLSGVPIAFKVMRPEMAVDDEAMSRFSREIFAVDELRHPGVPECYGYGHCSDGRPFAAFAFVAGETLRERILRNQPLDLVSALSALDDLLEILMLAHQKGILHRDVKPSNVMIGPDHLVHLLDFGLAQLTDTPDDLRATAQGFPVGTPAYMPPELANADREAMGPSSDLFSLALTIASGIAGRSLRQGPSAIDVLAEARLPFLPLRTFGLALPSGVEALLDKALSLRPEDRFPDAESMQRATRLVGRSLGLALPLRRTGSGELLPKEVASETTIVTAQVGDDYDWLPMSAAPRQQIPSDIAEQELYDDSEPPDSEPLIGLGATVRLHEDATNDIWSPSSSSSPLLRQQENIRGSFQENNPTNGRPRAEEQTGVIDRGALIPSLNSITARRLRVAPTRRSRMPQWLDEALRAPPFEFAGLRVRPIDVTLATIALIIWAAALLRWILLR